MNELLGIIGGDNVETLLTHETLARMSLSAVKQPDITKAYEEILGFEGAEFYTKDWPSLTGPSRTSISLRKTDSVTLRAARRSHGLRPTTRASSANVAAHPNPVAHAAQVRSSATWPTSSRKPSRSGLSAPQAK